MILTSHPIIRYATFEELSVDTLMATEWLSPAEHQLWSGIRSSMRRRTFLAGRFLAKQMLAKEFPDLYRGNPRETTIISRNRDSRGCRPRVESLRDSSAFSMSIAHNEFGVLVAGSTLVGIGVGVDLVADRHLGAAFENTWFTPAESALLNDRNRNTSAAHLWAMKEATYKACNVGEPFRPRQIEARWTDGRWESHYSDPHMKNRCHVCTWRCGDEIAALALSRTPGAERHPSVDSELQSALRAAEASLPGFSTPASESSTDYHRH